MRHLTIMGFQGDCRVLLVAASTGKGQPEGERRWALSVWHSTETLTRPPGSALFTHPGVEGSLWPPTPCTQDTIQNVISAPISVDTLLPPQALSW